MSEVVSTSAKVSWQAVNNADRYTVTLSQTMGDDQLGLCPEDSHTVSVNTSSLSVVVGQTGDDILKVYTTYSITVVAESDVWCRYRVKNILASFCMYQFHHCSSFSGVAAAHNLCSYSLHLPLVTSTS